jgi:hypothetical protein
LCFDQDALFVIVPVFKYCTWQCPQGTVMQQHVKQCPLAYAANYIIASSVTTTLGRIAAYDHTNKRHAMNLHTIPVTEARALIPLLPLATTRAEYTAKLCICGQEPTSHLNPLCRLNMQTQACKDHRSA